MNTIFTVSNNDLERLGPQEAVDIFRKLLWAEARRIGIPITKVHVSSWIDVPDGGIDALVEENNISEQNALIRVGYTGYQIKTGKSFSPWQKSEIKNELFKSKTPSRENLGGGVKDCLDNDGTYVLVCFKQDLADPQRRNAVGNLEYYFKACGYTNPQVEVWSLNNIISFLTPHPSLILELKGLSNSRFQTHRSWSENDDMKKTLVQSPDYEQKIESIRQILRDTDQARHIRIIGEAGVGKTRTILEATKAEDIAPSVIYTRASDFIRSDLLSYIWRDDNRFLVIGVVDECNQQQGIELWNLLKNRGSRIKLITIYNETETREYGTDYPTIPELSVEEIKGIILNYRIPRDQVDRWAELAGSSPRFAHMIGTNLSSFPDDILRPVEGIYDRVIAGYEDPNSEEVRQRKRALRYIALFKRFGYTRPVEEEARAIAKILEKADRNITLTRFQEIVETFRSQNYLQGETTLYITPNALHIRMWIEWWDNYGETFNLDEFFEDIPENSLLRIWFYEMFRYAAESGTASRIVNDLLGDDGPFQGKEALKTESGARFFLALTEADPKGALNCLKNIIGTWTKEELLKFTTGRREVIYALQKITFLKNLFPEAARLLLNLAEAENETWSNNATGVFAELFSPAWGPIAPTEASPEERFPILKEALESKSKERRSVGLRACDMALKTRNFVRHVGAEYRGLQKEPDYWVPKTYGELFEAYRQVWYLLIERLDDFPGEEQQETIKILLNNARGLAHIQSVSDMVITSMSELTKKTYVDRKELLTTIVHILHYDRDELSTDIQKSLEKLKEELTGTDFPSLMRRYVGMSLLEDKYDEKGNYRRDQTQPQIERLAQQVIENNDLLHPELSWLGTNEASNGSQFGYELGKRDDGFSLLPSLLKAQLNANDNASLYFVGGYFRALFEDVPQRWEEELDAIISDNKMNSWIPELTLRSGMSDQAVMRILNLAQKNVISIEQLKIYSVGGAFRNISEKTFIKWIEYLLGSSDPNAILIVSINYHFYYCHDISKHPLPKELTLKFLTHHSLFQKSKIIRQDQMVDFYWGEIAKKFIKKYPENSLELADIILQHFGKEETIFDGYRSKSKDVLNDITQQYPKEIWQLVTKYLGPPIDSRAFHLKHWLRGELGGFTTEYDGAIKFFDLKDIWKWVKDDIEKRAWYLASFVPPYVFHSEDRISLARETLVRYGDRKDVRDEFISNYFTEGWSGPASQHYIEKKEKLLEFKKGERNDNVLKWVEEALDRLEMHIEERKALEERDF